jgi:RNA polymerase sigma-70 factor (ECF subfamily)
MFLASWLLSVVQASFGVAADEVLIKGALEGSKRGMRTLTRRLLPVVRARVSAYLRRRGGALGGQDVDDLMQEIWLTLFERSGQLLRGFDAERGMSLEGYVGMVCRRELWRRNRAHMAERRGGGVEHAPLDAAFDQASSTPDPEAVATSRDLMAGLDGFLGERLSERGRLVLRALYEDQLGPSDAATMLGVKVQVIYNWQHKIRGLTREYFEAAGVRV